jgi:dimethylhistidine N-methyltransferase
VTERAPRNTPANRTRLAKPQLGKQRAESRFLADVLAGLARPAKALPSKYFYDKIGSDLFDRIAELDEYYLTRAELAIMEADASQMAETIGPHTVLVELGSGSSIKTRLLLDQLAEPAAYVPIDISGDHLAQSSLRLAAEYPSLTIKPLEVDYSAPFTLPPTPGAARTAVYFPGSTIGNLPRADAVIFLRRLVDLCGPRGALLVGADLVKDRAVLEAAYNDSAGVTAQFNLNLLARINRELGGDFRLDQFEHRALYNETAERIESYLVSRERQTVHVAGQTFQLAEGESIWTEQSHKYTLESFEALAVDGGFAVRRVWTDPARWFSVQYLEPVA